jgi:16S rRNA (cytosine967-C5)-methyltransferase
VKAGVDVRVRAARVVHEVAHRGVSLAQALPGACEGIRDARDVGFLKALAFGTVRAHPRLVHLLKLMLDRPLSATWLEIESVLCVGLHQLGAMRVPPHAAVAASVEAARIVRGDGAAGLVNAVLRRYQRDGAALEAAAARDEPARYACPAWLLDRLRSDWPDDWGAIAEAGNVEPPLWLRVNVARTTREDQAARLQAAGDVTVHPSPHAPAALRLDPPCDVEALPGFSEGLVSVQDAAAQLAAPLLDPGPHSRVLDACAAPGGKTAHILERVPEARVLALDIDEERLARMATDLKRLGVSAELRCADAGDPAAWWDGEPFDRILLDAPCTATGVIRRHPDIKLLRRDADADVLARGQDRLLSALWPLLAPGGSLLYATCSVLPVEGRDRIEAFLERHDDARSVPVDAPWGRRLGPGRQILPGEAGMDGFYYSCLEKTNQGRSG